MEGWRRNYRSRGPIGGIGGGGGKGGGRWGRAREKELAKRSLLVDYIEDGSPLLLVKKGRFRRRTRVPKLKGIQSTIR